MLAFTKGESLLALSDIARALHLPKSAVHRTLHSLMQVGLIAQDEATARYRLGHRAIDLGEAAAHAADLRTLSLPLLEQLSRESGETATLSLLASHASERVYVQQVESKQNVRYVVDVGRRSPLYAGASGRVIMAFMTSDSLDTYLATTALVRLTPATIVEEARIRRLLASARRNGYVISLGERDVSAAAVAAPLLRDGVVCGSVSLSGPLSRLSRTQLRKLAPAVVGAAEQLGRIAFGAGRDRA